jgi:glyoxylase-like metal-dependent hydrolase (beta-lactamase superfamily II)
MPELKAAIVPVTPFQQNCTILWQEPGKRGVVIDPGGEVPRILEAIGKLEVKIERILLTHGHIDHAGGAAALKEALEQAVATGGAHGSAAHPAAEARPATVPIEGPDQRDRFLLQGLETQAPMFGLSGVRNVLPDRWLAEGDEVRSAITPSRCCTARAIPQATSYSSTGPLASPSSAMCCSPARSGAPTFPTVTTPP